MYQVLSVAYPLLTVSEESAGGAEQMLWTLEREIAAQGFLSTVAASAGSRVSGQLFSTGDPCVQTDDFERRNHEHQERIIEFIRVRAQKGRPFDLVHDQSGSFWPRAAEIDVPVLATLHLPRHFYPTRYFHYVPANVSFNCVSQSQAGEFSDLKPGPAIIPNGISLEQFHATAGQRAGLLWLGRICEEKGAHLALEIAARTGLNMTLAGQVYPFSYHQQYFQREIVPRLDQTPNVKFISCPDAKLKRQLLRQAQAVLITSLVNETSSLVAMEAAASGTPVIAFRNGALPEIVQDGTTGFVVDGVDGAVEALEKVEQIKPEVCIDYANEHFSSKVMAQGYARLYGRLLQHNHFPSSQYPQPLSF